MAAVVQIVPRPSYDAYHIRRTMCTAVAVRIVWRP